MDLRIREMTDADCDAVAEIRVRGWQSAYRGMVPQPYLDALSVEQDAARRRLHLRAGGPVVNLVAERAGTVVGWACHGPYREGAAHTPDAELYALYVHPAQIGTGAGRALLARAQSSRAALGHPHLLLWVLKENTRARRFYERAGFAADGVEEPFDVRGVSVPEVRYARALP
ncbi:GNAT family N-acetyltransferase [Streptomyces apocyni]|uniref:GNAT family N-acetyltransferase n=1 Tax=Streptomyces apocyni TaxID=2654677 RepID=UPI001E376B63|nr:GNAT family N-acetyltransferase [Streptomyces apocyni]